MKDYKEISLTKGKVAMIDIEDFELVSQNKWHVSDGYAARAERIDYGKYKVVKMHRIVMNCPQGLEVDHLNGDKLDNRKSNLRICTHQQNTQNRKIQTNSGGYKGVYFYKNKPNWKKRYLAHIKQKNLGCYATALEAARVYNKAALEIFGEFARLNEI